MLELDDSLADSVKSLFLLLERITECLDFVFFENGALVQTPDDIVKSLVGVCLLYLHQLRNLVDLLTVLVDELHDLMFELLELIALVRWRHVPIINALLDLVLHLAGSLLKLVNLLVHGSKPLSDA